MTSVTSDFTVLFIKKKFGAVFVLFGSTVFIIFMFLRIQLPSIQHYYNFEVQVALLCIIGLGYIIGRVKYKKAAVGVMMVLLLVYFAHGLIPCFNLGDRGRYYASVGYVPPHRDDVDEIRALVSDLQDLTQDGKTAYSLLSSVFINEDTLCNVDLPYSLNACPMLYPTYHADLEWGFPTPFFHADYLLVADPAQTHLYHDGQRVVWYLNDLVLDPDSVLADNYRRISEYKLDNDITVYIYEKTADLTEDDYQLIYDSFNGWYPDYPELFGDRIRAEMGS